MHYSLSEEGGWEEDASPSFTSGWGTKPDGCVCQGKVPAVKPSSGSAWLPFLTLPAGSCLQEAASFLLANTWRGCPDQAYGSAALAAAGSPTCTMYTLRSYQPPPRAPPVPSKPAVTHLQPHTEAPVRQQVDAPSHHIFGQLSVAWQRSFSFCVRVAWLKFSNRGNLIWKTKLLLKP